MDRAANPRRRLPRWLAAGLWAGAPLLGLGCALTGQTQPYPALPPPPAAPRQVAVQPPQKVVPVAHVEPAPPQPAVGPLIVPKELPIALDTVLRLAEQSNPRIGLAREKLNESQMSQAGCNTWLPNV